ncbi:MAG: DciA family protein [Acetobacteraceae bacterium]
MTKVERHVYGPRPISALLPALTRPAFRRNMPALAQVMLDWTTIVGPALAEVTSPRRLSGGTLTIACVGPIAMELQHMAVEVMNRINGHVGTPTVRALRFMQVAAIAPRSAPTPVPQWAVEAAEAAVADLPSGEVRDALVALGRHVLTPKRAPRRNSPNR